MGLSLLFISLFSFWACIAPERFVSKESGFSITVPDGYKVKPDYSEQVPVILYSPAEGDKDEFTENINVVTQTFDGDIETYFQANVMGMNNLMREFKMIKSGSASINGLESRWILYSFAYGEKTMKVLAYCFTVNGTGYVITCSAVPDSYERFEKTFRQTCESFQKE